MCTVSNDQVDEFDNIKLTKLDSITVKRNPSTNIEQSIEKYNDDSKREGTFIRNNQSLQNYFKVTVNNTVFSLTKYDRKQFADPTVIKYPNQARFLLQQWIIKCNDKNSIAKK